MTNAGVYITSLSEERLKQKGDRGAFSHGVSKRLVQIFF